MPRKYSNFNRIGHCHFAEPGRLQALRIVDFRLPISTLQLGESPGWQSTICRDRGSALREVLAHLISR